MDASTKIQTRNENALSNKSSRKIKWVDCGSFKYLPDSREIRLNGEINKLAPTPAAILNYLIQNQGKVILRQEIVAAAWTGRKEVTEANFYQMIRRLRKAVGDTTEPRKVIINPSKNVYRLKPKATICYQRPPKEKMKIVWWSIGLSVLLVSAIATFLNWPAPEKIAGYIATDYRPITTLKGKIKTAVMSPDSSVVVFTHQAPDSSGEGLMANRIGTEEYVVLVPFHDSMHNREPSFSPSGNQLAWVTNDLKENARCRIMIADFDSKRLMLSNERVVVDCSMDYYGHTPQWKTENTLLVSLPSQPAKPSGIVELDLMTNEQFVITAPKGVGYGDYGLFYNRSANKMSYIRQLASIGTGVELRLYDFNNKTDTRIKNYTHLPYTVTWIDSEKLLTNGRDRFEVVSLNGQTFPIHSDSIDAEYFPFSMGDYQIGFVKGDIYGKDINVIDLLNLETDSRLSSISHDYRAVMAKNTDDIAFVSTRNGNFQVFITDNGIPTQITHFEDRTVIHDIAISPNGDMIAIAGYNQLTILNNSGKVLYQKQVYVKGISFSPDSKSLLFGVSMEGSQLIRQVSLSNFTESTITDGFMPKMDEEGNIYFFRSLRLTKKPLLYKMTKRGGVIELFDPPFKLGNSNSFDIMHNQLFYVRPENNELMLVSQSLTTGKITPITTVTDPKFSLNKNVTKLVTTQQGNVQNNLASFRLVQEK